MCGIIGLMSDTPVNQRVYDALHLLQHRGQDAAGIATLDGLQFHFFKGLGLVRDVFRTRNMRDLTGSSRERQELLAAQIRLNERETENAPSSVLRLWRSFLGWVLALLFCWEVPVRLLLLPLLAPDLLDDLPPPALDQILGLLAGMLGLPF